MDDADTTHEVHVDGEVFQVTRRDPSTYDYLWVSGPNEGYGFSSGSNVPHEQTPDEIVAAIRNFLAQIDPATGYIGD